MNSNEEEEASHIPLPELPEEMWYHIFWSIANSKDVENITKASHNFDKVLVRRKATILLDKVLPFLVYGGYVDGRDIMKMRMVSAAWRDEIDKFIQTRQSVTPYDDSEYLRCITPKFSTSSGEIPYTTFNPTVRISNNDIQGFLKAEDFMSNYRSLNYGQRNPFIGACVQLYVNVTEVEDFYRPLHVILRGITPLLEELGHHIEHLRIAIAPYLPIELTYMLCMECSKTCVNLKSMCVSLPDYTHTFNHDLLENLLKAQPNQQQALPHLESLEIFESSYLPVMLMKIFASPYLSQLKKLTVSHWLDIYATANFPNLKELCLFNITSNDMLKEALKFNAQIQKLTLYFRYEDVDFNLLHRVLKKFPLCTLNMGWLSEYPRFPFVYNTSTEDLIPTVHTVIMENSINVNYSFLCWFPNLQYLTVYQDFPPGTYDLSSIPLNKEIIDLVANYEKVKIHAHLYYNQQAMYQSNVWEFLPKLKFITSVRRKRPPQQQDAFALSWIRGSNYVYIAGSPMH